MSIITRPDTAATEAASENDRLWFDTHPHRAHRVRPYVPGEFPGDDALPPEPGWRRFTVVRQLYPGARTRMTSFTEGEPAEGEFAAARWFDYCARGERWGGGR